MAAQVINGVPHPPLLPPGYRFHPTSSELFRHYLYDRVTKGFCQWSIVTDTDVLALPPWDLPGMDSNENEGYYFYAREKKSKSAGYDRVIKVDQKAYWKMSTTGYVWEEELLWGRRNTLNYYSGPNEKTDWLMYEFVLDSSLAEGKDDGVVLCKVYKKKDPEEKRERGPEGSNVNGKGKGKGKRCQESSEKAAETVPAHDIDSGLPLKRRRMNASSSACFPQLNQKTKFAAGASRSAAPYIQETHSEASILPSFSAEPYIIEGIHPAEVAAPCTTYNSADAAPVDDPKLCYRLPAAIGSADLYLQETHQAAAEPCTMNYSSPAEPSTMAASSSSNTIAPFDDPNVYWTENELEQELQQYLSFDLAPADDDFDKEFFAPFLTCSKLAPSAS
ncbi:hypothetical protein SLEP1_g21115 [Rubroshorea leprosula]|uniref:NAC domain-containing protein n=1 Tax=Rubroshorea leprosula TaxID=152421 RepID=A0AAV5JE22_9ROSI|nr:hypothetical protein SLEP1_g21115 [Rubroshorea leprosula]